MIIKNNNLSDFITMITTCIYNGETNVRVFISEKRTPPSISFGNEERPYTEFTYLFLSPIYQAVYQDKLKNQKYEELKKQFFNFQDTNADKFRIQVFDSIAINFAENSIFIGEELRVI